MTEALEAHLRRQIEHSRRFFWHRLRWRAVRSYLPKEIPFGLVDVGAGAGLLGDFLARDRPRASYHFVEPIESLRTFLCECYGSRSDAAGWVDYSQAQFVTLLDVLEHQQDDRTFLRDLVTKMQPGATLILTVPAEQKLWSQWDVALGHFRRYDRFSLLQCVNALPLSVTEVSYLFPEMVPLGMMRARKRKVRPLTETDEDAEFPDLPGIVNDVAYGLGTVSLGLRRHWTVGTSLLMVATVETGAEQRRD